MSGRHPQVLRMSWSVVIPCIYGSYHLYRAKLLAKVKNQDDSSKKNSDISIAACRSCKKVMKCLMADHQDGKKDFKTVERLKWEEGRGKYEESWHFRHRLYSTLPVRLFPPLDSEVSISQRIRHQHRR